MGKETTLIYKSKAVSRIAHKDTGDEQVDEACCICENTYPGGASVLRRHENNKIICIPCLVEIAEVTINEPIPYRGGAKRQ